MHEYLGKFYSVKTQRALDRNAVKRLRRSEKHELGAGGAGLVSVQQRRDTQTGHSHPTWQAPWKQPRGSGEAEEPGNERHGKEVTSE